MSDQFGTGMKIYYEKGMYSVFFPDDGLEYMECEKDSPLITSQGVSVNYKTGELLARIIDLDSLKCITDEVLVLIKMYPGYENAIEAESIIDSYVWLCLHLDTGVNRIAYEIFKSGFYQAIDETFSILGSSMCSMNMGGFLLENYETYYCQITEFFSYFLSWIRVNSNLGTEEDIEAIDFLEEVISGLEDDYTRKCSVRAIRGSERKEVTCYLINTPMRLFVLEYQRMKKENILIKECLNCGGFFLPKRSDAIYCDRPVDGREGKTCKDIGPQNKRIAERHDNPLKQEENRIYAEYGRKRGLFSTEEQFRYSRAKALEEARKKWKSELIKEK